MQLSHWFRKHRLSRLTHRLIAVSDKKAYGCLNKQIKVFVN